MACLTTSITCVCVGGGDWAVNWAVTSKSPQDTHIVSLHGDSRGCVFIGDQLCLNSHPYQLIHFTNHLQLPVH